MTSLAYTIRPRDRCSRRQGSPIGVQAVGLSQQRDDRRRVDDARECTTAPCPPELLAFVLDELRRLAEKEVPFE